MNQDLVKGSSVLRTNFLIVCCETMCKYKETNKIIDRPDLEIMKRSNQLTEFLNSPKRMSIDIVIKLVHSYSRQFWWNQSDNCQTSFQRFIWDKFYWEKSFYFNKRHVPIQFCLQLSQWKCSLYKTLGIIKSVSLASVAFSCRLVFDWEKVSYEFRITKIT